MLLDYVIPQIIIYSRFIDIYLINSNLAYGIFHPYILVNKHWLLNYQFLLSKLVVLGPPDKKLTQYITVSCGGHVTDPKPPYKATEPSRRKFRIWIGLSKSWTTFRLRRYDWDRVYGTCRW